jgi:ATP-dependent protease ClpP protease subunit
MKLSYRNQKNAEATAKYWNKPLDRPDWYKIESLSDDEAEILLYDVIGWPFNDAGDFVRTLIEMKQSKITVRINSPGGDVFDAMAIYNALRSHKSKIITRVESLAASAASVITLAGKEVHAYQNTMFMIHNAWAFMAGNQYDLREGADILGKIDENMVDIYAENATPGKKEIREMMKAETWLTAKEAKEKGFIDTIIDGKAAKAQFDLSMFAHAPDDFRADGHEPTEREIERLLRDAGVPRNKAKAILAGCRAGDGMDEVAAEIKKNIAILGG